MPAAGDAIAGSLCTDDAHVAIVTDDTKFQAGCPVLRFTDTIWLQLLAGLAWDKALTV